MASEPEPTPAAASSSSPSPSPSRLVSPASVSACPPDLLLPALLRAFPLLSLAEHEGKGRGLVLARDAAPGTVLAAEESFCWEVVVGGATGAGSGEVGRAEVRWKRGLDPRGEAAPVGRDDAPASAAAAATSASSVGAGGDALLLQMAPYALTPDLVSRARFRPLGEREVFEATFKANSFAVTGEANAAVAAGEAADASASSSSSSSSSSSPPTAPLEGRALFSCICIANHSCNPTCKVYQGPAASSSSSSLSSSLSSPSHLTPSSPPVYCLEVRDCRAHLSSPRAAAAGKGKGAKKAAGAEVLPAGSEVSISYVPRAWAKRARGEALQASYGFACACTRCALPYDDTRVARCGACKHPDGRIYLSDDEASAPSACSRCGAPASASVLAALADDDVLAPILDTPMAMDKLADALLDHPVLAHDDARLFTALSQLLGAVAGQHAVASAEGDRKGERTYRGLYERLARALAVAAMRSPFTSLGDLGIEVEE